MAALLECMHSEGFEAGCDEAGRGCLAGPVVAAAVILPKGYAPAMLHDSKQVKAHQRELLRISIEKEALAWAVGWVCPEEIDRINILKASFLAMHRALDQLNTPPSHILVDGNRFTPYKETPHTCVVKGDATYRNIAAASILAKTHRDAYMMEMHLKFPEYRWDSNKGYPTRAHRQAIASHGSSPLHRSSFRLLPKQLELFREAV